MNVRRPAIKLFFLVAAGLIFSGAAGFADTNLVAGKGLPLPDAGVSVLRVLGALAVVIGIFFGGVWLFRNWQRLVVHRGQTPKLNILESRPLGNRHGLHVVGYEQQRLLLASSPSGVTLISQLPDAATAKIPATATVLHPSSDEFKAVLARAINPPAREEMRA